MGVGVRLFSLSKLTVVVAVTLALAACAGGAPSPPDDYSSTKPDSSNLVDLFREDASLGCESIDSQLADVDIEMGQLNASIAAKRRDDQSVFIGSLFFFPVLLAANDHTDAKVALDELQTRRASRLFTKC